MTRLSKVSVSLALLCLTFLIHSCALYLPRGISKTAPKDLDGCFVELERILSPAIIDTMKTGSEGDMIMYHLDLGMWIRNNWGLWGGSDLSKWFNARGVVHPDNMSGIILDSFWRHLHGLPIEFEQQVTSLLSLANQAMVVYPPLCPTCKKNLRFCTSGVGLDPNHPIEDQSVYSCLKGHNWYWLNQHGFYQASGVAAIRAIDSILEHCPVPHP